MDQPGFEPGTLGNALLRNLSLFWRVFFGVIFDASCSVDKIPQRTRQIFQHQFGVYRTATTKAIYNVERFGEETNNVEIIGGSL